MFFVTDMKQSTQPTNITSIHFMSSNSANLMKNSNENQNNQWEQNLYRCNTEKAGKSGVYIKDKNIKENA